MKRVKINKKKKTNIAYAYQYIYERWTIDIIAGNRMIRVALICKNKQARADT